MGNTCVRKCIRTDARLVNSGDGKWAFSDDFREARIDLFSVGFIKKPGTAPIRIDLPIQDGNGKSSRQAYVSFGRLVTDSTTMCSGRGRERLVPASLFGPAQPRKQGVEEGVGLGGGFARRGPWRDGRWRRGHLGAAVSLVAAVGSAATRSEEAKLLWGLIEK